MRSYSRVGLAAVAVLAACGGSTEPDLSVNLNCTSPAAVTLAPGEYTVLDATVSGGCIRIPAAPAAGAEYVIAAVSAAQGGQSASYTVAAGEVPAVAPAAPRPQPAAAGGMAGGFHDMLRAREAEVARNPALRLAPPVPGTPVAAPPLGDVRTFKVCGDVNCTSFANVTATAKFVGARGAIYLDNTVPSGGYTQGDIDQVGALFDGPAPNMYGLDTTAFGRESDLDNNGVVIILLSDQVNQLSGTCADGTIILGYFFGLDLSNDPNSNHGEVFYGLVPDPNNSGCTVSRNTALLRLPPVFIHEFQHMISFNQHVLVRSGPAELTWLNEGLSHFAEELGARGLPDSRCPLAPSCLSQFVGSGDIQNAFLYLSDIEGSYLIAPSGIGTLAERGADWLFVRWLADQFATDTLLGTSVTRALVQTVQVGAPNVVAVTATPFDQLVGQWQLANLMEGVSGFTEPTGRLRYRSWDFATLFPSYPVNPDRVTTGQYSHAGTLRAGSGRHVYVLQQGNDAAIDFQFKGGSGFSATVPRYAILRRR